MNATAQNTTVNASSRNVMPPVGLDVNGTSFESLVTGHTTRWNLYNDYATNKSKPIVISETGAAYYLDEKAGPGELEIKRTWWDSLYNSTLLEVR